MESSSEGLEMLCRMAWEVKSRPLGGLLVGVVGGEKREGGGKVPDEPEETFGCGMFFCFELVEDEGLERFGLGGGG